MSALQYQKIGNAVRLHVFAQDGHWHWGITVPRENGSGLRVIAYNETNFAHERDAWTDGGRMLDAINAQLLLDKRTQLSRP